MKFKKPSSKGLQEAAVKVGGLSIGAAVSRGVVSLIHKEETKATAEEQKKYDNMGLLKRAAIVAVTGYVGAGLEGNDTVTTLSKHALYGMSIMQLLELVKHFTAKTDAGQSIAASTDPGQKFLARTLGLGCACDQQAAFMPQPVAMRMPLRNPALVESMRMPAENAFEAAINKGKYASYAN